MRLTDVELLTEHLFANIEHDKTVDDGIEKTDKEVFAFKCGWNDALKSVMENAPTIDAVEVVRCKDCKHYLGDGLDECELMDAKSITASINSKRWYSDFFCAWGERKEDA